MAVRWCARGVLGGQQGAGVVLRRTAQHLFRRCSLHDLPGVQHHDLIGQGPHEIEVVAQHDHGDAPPGQRGEFGADFGAGDRVLAGSGFVGDDHRGVSDQGLGDHETLLLPAGQLVRVAPQERGVGGELGPAQGIDNRARRSVVFVRDLAQHRSDAAYRVQHRGRVLRYVSHDSGTRWLPGADVPSGDAYPASHLGARGILAQQGESGGGLPAAGRADQRAST